jgi:hypothetical protein
MQCVALIFRRASFSVLLLAGFALPSVSQNVGVGTKTPNPNAILDITAPNNDQGLLMPRLSTSARGSLATKINANANPAASNSLLVYDTDVQQYFYWATNTWSSLTGGTSAYVYVGYASDPTGTGYSTTPGPGLNYIAFLSTTSPVTPTAASFTGLWKSYAGAAGTNGTNGNSVLNGPTDPTVATGSNGDFYINTTTNTIFGPKAAGTWPVGVSLVGPSGMAAENGLSVVGGKVRLGGKLIVDTNIDLDSHAITLNQVTTGAPVGLRLQNMEPAAVENGVSISFGANTTSGSVPKEIGNIAGVMLDINEPVIQGNLTFSTNIGGSIVEGMRLDALGRLGIGSVRPTSQLQVNDDVTNVTLTNGTFVDISNEHSQTDAIAGIRFSTEHNTGTNVYKSGIFFRRTGSHGVGDLLFATNTDAATNSDVTAEDLYTKMQLTSGGSLGVGTTSPDRKLEVEGSGDQALRVTTTSGGSTGIELKTGGGNDVALRNNGGALQVLGGDVDASTVSLYSFTSAAFAPGTDIAQDLGAPTQKWRNIYTLNAPIIVSDRRLKENIKPLHYGLREVLDLRPVSYQWKNGRDGRNYLGLIAQEVRKIVPEVVNEGSDEDKTLGVKYSDLVPVLINAIQQQQKAMDEQNAENVKLRERLEKLEAQNTAMLKDLDQIKKAVGVEAKVISK